MARKTQLLRAVNRKQIQERLRSLSNRRLRERLQALLFLDDGLEAQDVAEKIGRCRQSVAAFVRLFNQGGVERLTSIGRGPGRQSRLSPSHRKTLRRWIQQGPRKQGFPLSNWDCPRLVYAIQKQWKIALSDEQVRRILHSLGCTLLRPKHELPKQNPAHHSKKNATLRGCWHAPAG